MRMILNVWTTFNKISGYSGVLPLCGKEPLLCVWLAQYRYTATLEVWNVPIFYSLNENWVMVILLLSSCAINCTFISHATVQSILCNRGYCATVAVLHEKNECKLYTDRQIPNCPCFLCMHITDLCTEVFWCLAHVETVSIVNTCWCTVGYLRKKSFTVALYVVFSLASNFQT